MISIIIPVLDEEASLTLTLAALCAQCGNHEVNVVEGGSSDRTREIAAAASAVRLISSRRGRAAQMNAGARVAHA